MILLLLLSTAALAQSEKRAPIKEGVKSKLADQAPVKEKEAAPLPPKKLEEALRLLLSVASKDSAQNAQRRFRPTEIEGLVIDQTVSKIGHDFYDVFFGQWDPPSDLGDFTVVVREKPGRGNNTLVSVEVNESELLELPLPPRYEDIEAAALYSMSVAVDFLVNSRNISQQLEQTADNPGTEVF
ncbi:CsgE family curli-type amyloid fiber assembly protein [Hymenobacter jejuensis]|uniref:CsgE family curli-type amyloid fiber assembly protein n=1 Tax=Hymenobacter jejuensis TaxID=2502781 RepID=UPI0013FD003B|nr:CsgE family curli-type amyloid fiber assembly protein [Hymenobacter jejuensis]